VSVRGDSSFDNQSGDDGGIPPTPPSEPDILAQLDRVILDRVFGRARRRCDLLRFLVTETLAGRGEDLTGKQIAWQFLRNSTSRDPGAVARGKISDVRDALAQYYSGAGKTDRVRIEIPLAAPTGSFAAKFICQIAPERSSEVSPEVRSPEVSGKHLMHGISQCLQFVMGRRRLVASGLALIALIATAAVLGPSSSSISLAVLPLVNESGNSEFEYLCDGMTDAITSRLSILPQIKLISRASVRRAISAAGSDARTVGKRLRVNFILTGTISKVDDQLRLEVHILDLQGGPDPYGRIYRRTPTQIVFLDQLVARDITEAFELHLTSHQTQLLNRHHTDSTAAFEWCMRGRYHLNRRSPDDLNKSLDYFARAANADPDYAPAYSGWAIANAMLASYGLQRPREVMPKAKEAARRAAQIDPYSAEAQAALATIADGYEWNWAEAERCYRRAINFDPNYAIAHQWLGLDFVSTAHPKQALIELHRAYSLDPLSSVIATHIGWAKYYDKDYDGAIAQYKQVLRDEPEFLGARWRLGQAYQQKHLYDAAAKELAIVKERDPHAKALFARNYALAGEPAQAQQVLAEILTLSKTRYISPFSLAMVYLALRDQERAIALLEDAYSQADGWLAFIKVEPALDEIRSDPRFLDLEHRIGLIP